MAVAAAQFVTEAGTVPGHLGGQFAGLGQGPPHPAVPAQDGRLVGDGEDGGEADAEAADGVAGGGGIPLGGGPQGAQGLHAGGVQRGAGVGGGQDRVAAVLAGVQGEPEPAGHRRAGGRVGGVLGQFDHEAVAVAAERQVLLGVGVLAEAGRARTPGVEHPAPQPGRAEGVRATLGRRHSHAHAASSKNCRGLEGIAWPAAPVRCRAPALRCAALTQPGLAFGARGHRFSLARLSKPGAGKFSPAGV